MKLFIETVDVFFERISGDSRYIHISLVPAASDSSPDPISYRAVAFFSGATTYFYSGRYVLASLGPGTS